MLVIVWLVEVLGLQGSIELASTIRRRGRMMVPVSKCGNRFRSIDLKKMLLDLGTVELQEKAIECN